jgi:CHAT domain
MADHEMTVTVQDERVVRVRRGKGAEEREEHTPDVINRRLIDVFETWLGSGKISRHEELEAFGALLYRTLFYGRVGRTFEEAQKEVPEGQRLRVQLSFEEAASELAGKPWEYLFYPNSEGRRGFFLATETNLVLSRFMPLAHDRPESLKPVDDKLQILIATAQPTDLVPVIAEPVIEAIQKLGERYPVEVEVLQAATFGAFVEKLEETWPHIVHFIGHGRYDRDTRRGEIAFVGPDEQAEWRSDFNLAQAVAALRASARPRLIFLHMCEGAVGDFRANFAGLAPQLLRTGVPAVVAMQHPITNRHAIAFSRAFYTALAKGQPVDSAVQEARYRMTVTNPEALDSRVIGTPVLHMYSGDGLILPGSAESTGRTTARSLEDYRIESTPAMNADAVIAAGFRKLSELPVDDDRRRALDQRLRRMWPALSERSIADVRTSLLERAYDEEDRDFKVVIRSMVEVIRHGNVGIS